MISFKLPHGLGATLHPIPFKVSIPDGTVDEMKLLIKISKIAPETYESSFNDHKYGVTRQWMIDAKQQWENHFDWRKTEDHINSFPHYTVPIMDDDGRTYTMHFVGLFSQKPDAIPIIMLHGWPGSFLEFLPIIDDLRKRYQVSDLPYHILVPSLPGYTFSSPPALDKDLRIEDIARIVNKLAVGLGFGDGYVVQGGDIGSKVARILGALYPSCKAVHLNYGIMAEPEGASKSYNPVEVQGLTRMNNFVQLGSAYSFEQATRPSTIGFVLASSPIALLAWIGEKFLEWTDADPPLETILESVSLYWLTETFPRSVYPYRQVHTTIPGAVDAHANTDWHIKKPFGYSWFPKEIAPVPKEWIATTGNLVFFREHTSGGHFAALERPEVLLKDVEDFIAQVWEEAKKN